MHYDHEHRYADAGLEIRSLDGRLHLSAYASKYGARSLPLYDSHFVEVVEPSAFRRTLADLRAEVIATLDHDQASPPLARRLDRTLELRSDAVGLRYAFDIPNTAAGRLLADWIEERIVTGSSFTFRSLDETWEYDLRRGMPVRHLRDLELREVAPVRRPAYPDVGLPTLTGLAEQRSLPLDTVVEAARAGELADVVRGRIVPARYANARW